MTLSATISDGLVLDASVFLSAFLETEVAHKESKELLFTIPEKMRPHISSFALWEISAALFRRTKDRAATERAMKLVLDLPSRPVFHLFDSHECQASFPDLLYSTALRAADLVYVSLALSTKSALITLDKEMARKAISVVSVFTPGEFVELSGTWA